MFLKPILMLLLLLGVQERSLFSTSTGVVKALGSFPGPGPCVLPPHSLPPILQQGGGLIGSAEQCRCFMTERP